MKKLSRKKDLIALFFATSHESRIIIEKIEKKTKLRIRNIEYVKGKLHGYDILLCLTGIGKVNSTISSLVTFEHFSINKTLISGVAGAYPSSGLSIGEIVVAKKEIEVDQGLLIDLDRFIVMNSIEVELFLPNAIEGFKKGNFLTVSSCTGNLKRAQYLESKFHGICENMEGAAIAKVCTLYNVPVYEIRSISNYVEDRQKLLNKQEVENAAEVVQTFIIDRFPQILELP